jgi:hypothetical protein
MDGADRADTPIVRRAKLGMEHSLLGLGWAGTQVRVFVRGNISTVPGFVFSPPMREQP